MIMLPFMKVRDRIHDTGFYVDVDTSDRTINKKVCA